MMTMMTLVMMIMMTLMLTQQRTRAMRCYTDIDATQVKIAGGEFRSLRNNFQSNSLECGMATGCVKILKRAYEFDHLGKFIPEHKRGQNVDLFRGQFVKILIF